MHVAHSAIFHVFSSFCVKTLTGECTPTKNKHTETNETVCEVSPCIPSILSDPPYNYNFVRGLSSFYNETKSPLYHSCKLNSKFIQILPRVQDNFDESSKIIMNAKRFGAKCFGGKIVLVHLECNYVSQS